MNELLAEYAGKALTWLESGAAWIAGEVPLYIEEVLRWNMARNIVLLIISLIFFILGIIGPIIVYKVIKKLDEDGFYNIISLVFALPLFFGFFLAIDYTMDIIQITVAPRVFLIEYLSKIM